MPQSKITESPPSGNVQGQNAEASSWRPEKQIRRWEESCHQPGLYESFWPKPIVRVWLVVSVKMNRANQHILRRRCWFCGSCTAHLACKNRCFSVSLGTQHCQSSCPLVIAGKGCFEVQGSRKYLPHWWCLRASCLCVHTARHQLRTGEVGFRAWQFSRLIRKQTAGYSIHAESYMAFLQLGHQGKLPGLLTGFESCPEGLRCSLCFDT